MDLQAVGGRSVGVDLELIRGFWRKRAAETSGSIRWTDERLMAFDLDLLRGVVAPGTALLDLGCGTGDLFLSLLDDLSHVTAVDMITDFLARIPGDSRIERVVADVGAYQPSRTYDVGLLFGVVTHLAVETEKAVYRMLRRAVPTGTVVVKNQCGRDRELLVDGWSDHLGTRYCARYPRAEQQADLLSHYFPDVKIVWYPEHLNLWDDSRHVAFICG